MKKLIALILSIALLMGPACSCAEETVAAGNFLQGLREWFTGLDLEKSDYKASIFSGGYQTAEVTVRRDQGITEIAVPGSRRMQISENMIVVDAGGQLYTVDLAAMKEAQQTFLGEDRHLDRDIEMLRPWLQKAFNDIILPSVELSMGRRGLTLHIDAGAEEIRERTYAWMDEFIADRNTVETILKRYGLYLGTLIPGMPQTYEELKIAWETEKANPGSRWPDFRITADITSDRSLYGRNISCVANLYFAGAGGARLSFELAAVRDGFDLVSSLDVSDGRISRRHSRSSSYEFDLHCHGNQLSGVLATPDDTYILSAEKKTEEDDTTHITATMKEQRSHGEIMLDAVYDPSASSLKARLYNMNSDYYDGGTPRELADLEAYLRSNGMDLSLSADNTRISVHTGSDYYYRHLKIDIDNQYNEDLFLDFWLQRADSGEVRLRLDSNFINAYNPHTYSLAVGKNGIDFSRTTGYGQFRDLAFTVSQKQTENGFEAEVSYLNLYEYNPSFNTGNRPSTLKIVRENDEMKAELDWSMEGRQAFAVSYAPGILTYTDGYGVYECRVTEDTAEKLVIAVTKDREELGTIVLTLKDGCLRGTLSAGNEEEMKIVIEPIEKKPIEVIRGI